MGGSGGMVMVAGSGHEWWVCWLFLLGRKETQMENKKE